LVLRKISPRINIIIDPSKVNDAIMKHNSARGANTMEFPLGKFAGGANTMVKTIDSRWRPGPWKGLL
jgi:hypothetical protein